MATIEGFVGKKVVVVGASGGIGRSAAQRLIESGADVLVAARRSEHLESLVTDAGGGSFAAADISKLEECETLSATASDVLGTIDVLLITAGATALSQLEDTSPEVWTSLLSTNVMGINLLIGQMVPHMNPNGIVMAISSESVDRPRFGLGVYASSKAAMEVALSTWRVEAAPLRFSCVSIGATVPTEIGTDYEPELAGTALENWVRHGHLQSSFMATDQVAESLVKIIASVLDSPAIGIEYAVLRSPAPVVAGDFFADHRQANGS